MSIRKENNFCSWITKQNWHPILLKLAQPLHAPYLRSATLHTRAILIILILVGAFSITGCGVFGGQDHTSSKAIEQSSDESLNEVDPVFREIYKYYGGEDLWGPPISNVYKEGTATVQYFENAKMVYDSSAPVEQMFTMAPIGRMMEVEEPPVPAPAQAEVPYINGHTINPVFLPLYKELGENMVGKPLTELRYNPGHQRFEQFFENLGFYRLEGSDQVNLLAYGAWACDYECRSTEANADAKMDILVPIDPAFEKYVEKMGADFTGFGLTDAYTATDGKKEQILENVVVAADPDQTIDLRPLSEMLSIQPEPPRLYSGDPNNYFYATDGDKGYEIPQEFWDYIVHHGGIEEFGPPITHYAPLFGTAYHQCYTKLCLAFNLSPTDTSPVRPEPLGYAYKVLYYDTKPAPTAVPTLLPQDQGSREIVLQVWVRYPAIDSFQAQEVGAIVMENDQPLADGMLSLILTLPDGSQQTYRFPPTNAKGISSLRIPPISGSNGTLVPYKVCLEVGPDTRFCVGNSFVIWNNP